MVAAISVLFFIIASLAGISSGLLALAIYFRLVSRQPDVGGQVHTITVSRTHPEAEQKEITEWVHKAKTGGEVLVLARAMASQPLATLAKLLFDCSVQLHYTPRLVAYHTDTNAWAPALPEGRMLATVDAPPKQSFVVVDRMHVISLDPQGPRSGADWQLIVYENHPRLARAYARTFMKAWRRKGRPVGGIPGQKLVAYNKDALPAFIPASAGV